MGKSLALCLHVSEICFFGDILRDRERNRELFSVNGPTINLKRTQRTDQNTTDCMLEIFFGNQQLIPLFLPVDINKCYLMRLSLIVFSIN